MPIDTSTFRTASSESKYVKLMEELSQKDKALRQQEERLSKYQTEVTVMNHKMQTLKGENMNLMQVNKEVNQKLIEKLQSLNEERKKFLDKKHGEVLSSSNTDEEEKNKLDKDKDRLRRQIKNDLKSNIARSKNKNIDHMRSQIQAVLQKQSNPDKLVLVPVEHSPLYAEDAPLVQDTLLDRLSSIHSHSSDPDFSGSEEPKKDTRWEEGMRQRTLDDLGDKLA